MNSKVLILTVVVVLVLGGGAFFLLSNNATPQQETTTIEQQDTAEPTAMAEDTSPSDVMAEEGTAQEFTITGSNFKFDVPEIRVKQGDTVKITFKSSGGIHDFVIDEFDVRTSRLQSGSEETIEFVANQAGEFEYYCSVGNHRQMGMKGTLIVE